MRQIKFRGKLRDGGKWVYGSLLTWPDGDVYMLYDKDFAKTRTVSKDPVIPETVGQFTGLKYKNGNEIYEGDVLTDSDGKGILHFVEYDNEEGAFVGLMPELGKDERGRTHSTGLRQWWLTKFGKQVIGNVHDNPELLQTAKKKNNNYARH